MISLPVKNRSGLVAAGLLLLGALLRFYGFWNWSLTNDEFSALNRLNFDSFGELISKGVSVDGHPAFTQIFLFYWTKIFGTSVFAIRLPFVLSGILALFFFYKLAKNCLSEQAALVALSLFSVSHLFVLYSQIARPYAFGLFFIIAFAFYWQRLISQQHKKKDLIFFILFGLLSLLTHYFTGLMLMVLIVYGFFKIDRSKKLTYFLLSIAIGILFLPHLSITLQQISIGGVSWLPEPEGRYLIIFLEFMFNNSRLFLYTALFIPLLSFFRNGFSFLQTKTIHLALLFLFPYLVAYFYSIHISPLLQFSVLLFFAPFLLLAVASFIHTKINQKATLFLVILITLTGLYSLVFQIEFFKQKRFADFKKVAELSIQWENELGEDKVVSMANFVNENYINYYLKQIQENYRYDIAPLDSLSANKKTQQLILSEKPDYVIVAFANVPAPKAIHEYIKQDYPEIVKQERFFNSEVTLYGKSNKAREKIFTTTYTEAFSNPKWSADPAFFQDSVFVTDSIAYYLSPATEYALTYKNLVSNLFTEKDKNLTLSAKVKSNTITALKLVCTIERDGEVIVWEALPCKEFQEKEIWFQIVYVLEKKANILPDDQVSIYFWNPNKDSAYIDDFVINNYKDSNYDYYEY